MTEPVKAAGSASCSAKSTVAPRPATRAGSRPARVTTGAGGAALAGKPAVAGRPSPTTQAVATAGHLAFTDIEELISLGRDRGVRTAGRRRWGEVTLGRL